MHTVPLPAPPPPPPKKTMTMDMQNLGGGGVNKVRYGLCENGELLVFIVTQFNIDQNKNQNRSIDKVQNLENKRRYICKDPRQISGQRNISYTRCSKKRFTQIL